MVEEAGENPGEVRAELEGRAIYIKLMASSKSIVMSPESYKLLKNYLIKYAISPRMR